MALEWPKLSPLDRPAAKTFSVWHWAVAPPASATSPNVAIAKRSMGPP